MRANSLRMKPVTNPVTKLATAGSADDYSTLTLVRRLLVDEALEHWPRYAFAFALMGVAATGTALRDTVRSVTQGGGTKVYTAVEGLGLLAKGQDINYEGASGPCDFNEIGDILDCKFRFNQVEKGGFTFIAVK